MKSISHYIYWLRRDFVKMLLSIKPLSLSMSKHHLKAYLSMFYFNWTGRRIRWDDPGDFNQWLMALSLKNSKGGNRGMIIQCADKYAVREFVEAAGYGHTLNELYGVYDSVDDIDFESLPSSFVMKMNNASGRNLICKDKSSICWPEQAAKFREWLADRNFGLLSGEWQYSMIEPKIVVERYLDALDSSSLTDYKFHVINGKVFSCEVGYDRNPDAQHAEVSLDDYDLPWNRTEGVRECRHTNRKEIARPGNLAGMVNMAEDLCRSFEYCRFDVYEVDGKTIFGEMTFTPNGCVLASYNDWYLDKMLDFAKSSWNEGQ